MALGENERKVELKGMGEMHPGVLPTNKTMKEQEQEVGPCKRRLCHRSFKPQHFWKARLCWTSSLRLPQHVSAVTPHWQTLCYSLGRDYLCSMTKYLRASDKKVMVSAAALFAILLSLDQKSSHYRDKWCTDKEIRAGVLGQPTSHRQNKI